MSEEGQLTDVAQSQKFYTREVNQFSLIEKCFSSQCDSCKHQEVGEWILHSKKYYREYEDFFGVIQQPAQQNRQ